MRELLSDGEASRGIAFSLKLKHLPKAVIDKKVREAAEIPDITRYLNRKPKDMSGVHLHVNAEGRDVIIIVPTADMVGNFEMGEIVRFSFKGNVAHVFSKETGKNLEF